MLYHAREGSVAVSGERMDYVAFGTGDRDLVIIPGLNLRSVRGSAGPLAVMYWLFAGDCRVWVFDRKARVPEGCTIADLADDVSAAMDALGIGEADVLGISQGGMIGQYLAIEHPERVRRLVLGVTASRPNDTLRRVVGGWIDSAERGEYREIVRDMMELLYSEQYVRKYRWLFPVLMKTAKLIEPEQFVRLAKACLTVDAYDRLGEIRCPVLVLGGKEDRIVTARASEEIAERLGCPIYMYDGLGHSAYEEGRDFNRRVYDFLKG